MFCRYFRRQIVHWMVDDRETILYYHKDSLKQLYGVATVDEDGNDVYNMELQEKFRGVMTYRR